MLFQNIKKMQKKKTDIFVSALQMRKIDKITSEKYGIVSLILMENAGKAVFEETVKTLKRLKNKTVSVVCGSGNNAGDGFVAARYLLNSGIKTKVILVNRPEHFKGDCKTNFEILKNIGVTVSRDLRALGRVGIVIDALLGTGLNGIIRRETAAAIASVNKSQAYKMSVDIPSGIDSDTGKVSGCAVRADKTVTLALHKAAYANKAARKYFGKTLVADIGIPFQAVKEIINEKN